MTRLRPQDREFGAGNGTTPCLRLPLLFEVRSAQYVATMCAAAEF